jgi:hypothetical protein
MPPETKERITTCRHGAKAFSSPGQFRYQIVAILAINRQ